MPHELRGNVPTVDYYNRFFGKGRWKSSTIISLAIGQGELGITPLQMANAACIVANKGYYYVPHIVKEIGYKHYLPDHFKRKITRWLIQNILMPYKMEWNGFLNVAQPVARVLTVW